MISKISTSYEKRDPSLFSIITHRILKQFHLHIFIGTNHDSNTEFEFDSPLNTIKVS